MFVVSAIVDEPGVASFCSVSWCLRSAGGMLPLLRREPLLSYDVPEDVCDISVDATVADDGKVSGGRMVLSEESSSVVALCLRLAILFRLASAGRDGEAANELVSAPYEQLSATRR